MWDWELLKTNSGCHHYQTIAEYKDENFQYTRAISQGSPDDEYCLHNHAMYEIVCGLHGDAVYMVEGVRYELALGGLLVINPTVSHKPFVGSSTPFERHTIYVYANGNSKMTRILENSLRNMDGKHIGSVYYSPEDARACLNAFNRMSEICVAEDENVRMLLPYFAQCMLAEISVIMRSKNPQQHSCGVSKTMDSLIDYLGTNFTQNLTLQNIADTFHLSKDYCNRLFHTATGMTVMQYILYNRILLARQFLMEGMSAAECARKVGYADYSSFYRAYRKVTGRSPSEDYEVSRENEISLQDEI